MDDDDLASGDEEVLAAAGQVSLSPRRTRSSSRAVSANDPVPSSNSDPVPSPVSDPVPSPVGTCDSASSSFAAVASDSSPLSPAVVDVSSAVPVPATDVPLPSSSGCDDSSDSSDSEAPDDEMASGDEEVLAAAGSVCLSPSCTRLSTRAAAASTPDSVSLPVPCDETEDYVYGTDPAQDQLVMAALDKIDFRDLVNNHGYTEDTVFSCFNLPIIFAFDFGRATRRIIQSDTATVEMYRECYYEDLAGTKHLIPMSVFPAGRGPLPPDILLDSSVQPSAFPVSS